VKKNLLMAVRFTLATTVLFGLVYPLTVTGLAQWLFPDRANGQLIERNGRRIGSRIIGQPFAGPGYFHSRPSAAGNGYDAASSGGSNLGPTNRALLERVRREVQRLRADNPSAPIPVDLVTASASGLDPDISPAAAEFQIPRVSRARHLGEAAVRALVARHTEGRQFRLLGEPRVNVLELNLGLDAMSAAAAAVQASSSPPAPPRASGESTKR
jgi:potassium-transporting ATPase KdpC subunit